MIHTHIFHSIGDKPEIRIGLGGNYYIISKQKEVVESVCTAIGKSTNSVYWSKKFSVWSARVKCGRHKNMLDKLVWI